MGSSKVVRLALAVVIAGILLVPLLPTARAPPLVPYEAWGLATNAAGSSIGLNQPIRTFIDGVDYSNATATYRADGSYQTQIAGNWYIGASSETPMIKEGGDPNDPVMFAHNDLTSSGLVFRQQAPWVSAGFQNLNLMEAVATKQPALIKIYSITTRPADTLSQYAYLCNPTASAVDLSNYVFEKDVVGSFAGPRVSLSGTLGAGQRTFGDFLSTNYLTNGGDILKLVFKNPGGVDSPFGGSDVVVDRVEFNASSSGTLTWEPGNTIMTDSPAPGPGQEIHRTAACADTNQGSDFTTGFETGRPTAPSVTVTSPNGAQRWTGGTPHAITFTLGDAQEPNSNLRINITYSTNSAGGPYSNLITTSLPGTGATGSTNTYNWNPVPSINVNTLRVLVCAIDSTALLGCDASNNDFEIDSTSPTVTNQTPRPGAAGVPVNADIVVTFSEAMDQASVTSHFTVNGPAPLPTFTFSWTGNTTTVSHTTPFVQGQTYQVTIGTLAKDTSDTGNYLIPSVQWSFQTFQNNAPSLTISAPGGTECWTGGTSHLLVWDMTDIETPQDQLVAYLNYTTGAGNVALAGPIPGAPAGFTTYSWTVATINSATVRIEITVIDRDGAKRVDLSNAFEIDSTPPTKLSSSPADTARGVGLTQDITVLFSEHMATTWLPMGFSISPNVVLSFQWTGNTLRASHTTAFLPNTVYTVTLSGARDDCDPGTFLTGSNTFSFTTVAPPTVNVTAPTAGASFSPGQGIRITWRMNDVETPVANLYVFLNYTSSAGSGQVTTRLQGATEYTWPAPSIEASDVRVNITVIDGDGLKAQSSSGAFAIKPAGLDLIVVGGLLGIILAVVIAALLYFLVFAKRRRREEEAPAPARAPARPVAPARAPAAPARPPPAPPRAPAGPPSTGTKECPSCGTIVDMKDTECFMCGHKW